MTSEPKSTVVAFDRRQLYRPFLERLNSVASLRELEDRGLIVPREHDPSGTFAKVREFGAGEEPPEARQTRVSP